MPRGRILDYLCHILIFRPWNFDGQSRVRCPGAIITHQTPHFGAYRPLICGLPLCALQVARALGPISSKNHPELKTATSMRAAALPAF
jgi:hypothetical protein